MLYRLLPLLHSCWLGISLCFLLCMHIPCLSLFGTKPVSGVLLLPAGEFSGCVLSPVLCMLWVLLCLFSPPVLTHVYKLCCFSPTAGDSLAAGLCVQAASTAHPGTVWKTNTDLCQSFSSLSFSPGTGKTQESSMAAAEPSSAHPFVWRKFVSKMCQSPFLVPELWAVARAEWKPWGLQSRVLMDGCCLGHKNHRGLHLARVETPDGVSMALRRRIHPYIQCTACGNEQLYWIRLSGVKAVKSASIFHLYIPCFPNHDFYL